MFRNFSYQKYSSKHRYNSLVFEAVFSKMMNYSFVSEEFETEIISFVSAFIKVTAMLST
jgi:hypothetical protein